MLAYNESAHAFFKWDPVLVPAQSERQST